MRSLKLKQAIAVALESVESDSKVLVKLSQDDYDDGIQTLVLHYSDGSHETVEREWPELTHRGAPDGGDSLHEWFGELKDAITDPNELWAVIQLLTLSAPGSGLNEVSTEGYLSDKIATAKEAVAQWTLGIRKWKAGEWSKLSEADQLRAVKKSHLTFFYYNPKYVKDLESLMQLTKSLMDDVLAKRDDTLPKTVEKLKPVLKGLLKALGGEDSSDTLKGLQHAFEKALKAYKPKDGQKGDPEVVPKIVALLDRYKVSVSTIDALKVLGRSVGLESDYDREYLEFYATCISWILFLSGMWPLLIIWLLGVRGLFTNDFTGGPNYT